jgi:hypothetical protein
MVSHHRIGRIRDVASLHQKQQSRAAISERRNDVTAHPLSSRDHWLAANRAHAGLGV